MMSTPAALFVMFAASGALLVWSAMRPSVLFEPMAQESAIQILVGEMPGGSLLFNAISRPPFPLSPKKLGCKDDSKSSFRV